MNTDDIIDALNEIDDTCIQKAREPKKKISRKALWISVGAVAACLAVLFLTPNALNPFYKEQRPSFTLPTLPPTAEASTSGRDYKSFGMVVRDEMISWGWERRTLAERFSSVRYNDTNYQLQKNVFEEEVKVPLSFLGEKLADATAMGRNWQTETDYTIDCRLYKIAGVDPDRYLAVQYAGEENAGVYYVFVREDAPLPATLGEFIAALTPSETLPLTRFEYITRDKEKDQKITNAYSLSPEDSKVVWDMITEYASARTETDISHRGSEEHISVYVSPEDASSAARGHSRKYFSLWDDGFLSVYIEKYNYHFSLGQEAVAEIQNYILSHKTKTPADSIKTLYGVVTEIGEDYIKIDDTILMKDPEEGMEYTIYTYDMHVKRHVLSGRIKVGSHVKILHRDVSVDQLSEIQTAFYLRKGGFVFEGDEAEKDSPAEPTATPYERFPASHVPE